MFSAACTDFVQTIYEATGHPGHFGSLFELGSIDGAVALRIQEGVLVIYAGSARDGGFTWTVYTPDGPVQWTGGAPELRAFLTDSQGCFLAGTPITMADGTTKPIEEIKVGDEVQSYDKDGELVPGTVSNTFVHDAKYILNFFGLEVTPGHVFPCGDGPFKGQNVPLIDILRTDGAVIMKDGTLKRAASLEEVGSVRDRAFVWAITGDMAADGSVDIKDRKKLRLSTRVITEEGNDISLADMIFSVDAIVNQNHLIQASFDSPEEMTFQWTFSDHLPNPEDYVLQRSKLTLNEIYAAGEWEQPPRLPAPVSGEAGPSFHNIPKTISAAAPPNLPLSLQGRPDAQPAMNRKQRKALEAKRRKMAKKRWPNATLQ